MHFDALDSQALFFEEGKERGSYEPSSMCSAKDVVECSLKTLRVTTCTLCACPFPLHDIDVFSCCHLYNPWCASVWLRKNSHFRDPLCEGLVPAK